MSLLSAPLFSAALVTILAIAYAASYLSVWSMLFSFGKCAKKGEYLIADCEGELTSEQQEVALTTYDRSWWTDEKLFQLERRAIFSKIWLYVTHSSRFQKPGDYRTFEIAGFSVIVILGKDERLRAFHNVCRHRAYAVTKKQCGSSIVLGCRYHGWSYDTKGKLTKAPEFDNVPGFDKDSNGLWEVKTEVMDGLVYINFQTECDLSGVDMKKHSRALRPILNSMTVCAEWEIKGSFNWKIAVDMLSSGQPRNDLKRRWWQSFMYTWFETQPSTQELSLTAFIRYLSPRCTMTIRILPQSKCCSIVKFDLYNISVHRYPVQQIELFKLKQDTISEVKQFERRQKQLLMNNYSSEKQDMINWSLQEHLSIEKDVGAEIHPAAQKQSFTKEGKEDDEWCKKLDMKINNKPSACSVNATGALDW